MLGTARIAQRAYWRYTSRKCQAQDTPSMGLNAPATESTGDSDDYFYANASPSWMNTPMGLAEQYSMTGDQGSPGTYGLNSSAGAQGMPGSYGYTGESGSYNLLDMFPGRQEWTWKDANNRYNNLFAQYSLNGGSNSI